MQDKFNKKRLWNIQSRFLFLRVVSYLMNTKNTDINSKDI